MKEGGKEGTGGRREREGEKEGGRGEGRGGEERIRTCKLGVSDMTPESF